jgi:hypothetical protein
MVAEPTGLVSAQVCPGTRTCIVVGATDGVGDLDLSACHAVLWFARAGARWSARLGVDPAQVAVDPVDRPDSARTNRAIDALIRRDGLHLPSVFFTGETVGSAAPLYLPVIEALLAQCEKHRRSRETRKRDGFLWQSHLLTNLPAYVRRRVPRAWAGALDGVPAFICGAGPSLDASMGALAPVARHGIVFAADSALRALDRAGLGVDFAVSMDVRKTPEKCLTPQGPRPGRVVVVGFSPPAWREAVAEERVWFLSERQKTEDWLATLGIAKTALAVGVNCGGTALELALHLGCRPIFLFGMDHAVDGRNPTRLHQQHLDATLHAQLGFQPGRNYPKVPGNYQEEIATPFLREWRTLDERCAGLPAGRVVNVTDRGARLRNTTLVHPDGFALAGAVADPFARLARLAPADSIAEADWRRLVKEIGPAADVGARLIGAARSALAAGDTARSVNGLRAAFRNRPFSALMGNYCLKVLPHLLQPNVADSRLWEQLVTECEELLAVARTIR